MSAAIIVAIAARLERLEKEVSSLSRSAEHARERGDEKWARGLDVVLQMTREEIAELKAALTEDRPTLRYGDPATVNRICKCGTKRPVDLDAAAAKLLHWAMPARVVEAPRVMAEVAESLLGTCPECGINDLMAHLGARLSTEA